MNFIDYLDYRIFYSLDSNKMRSTEYICEVAHKNDEDKIIFREITAISRPLLLTRFKDVDIEAFLNKETISRTKARISLLEFKNGEDYYKHYKLEKNIQEIDLPNDETVISKLLSSLLNIRRTMPVTYKQFEFEKEGFCNILGIDIGRFYFIKDLLLEEKIIAETENRSEFKDNFLYLTAKGYEKHQTISKRVVTMKGNDNSDKFEYDVVISFAGEDRNIAEEIVKELSSRKISYFYDNENESDLELAPKPVRD